MLSRRKILRLFICKGKSTISQWSRFLSNLQFSESIDSKLQTNSNDSFFEKVNEHEKKILYNTYIHGINVHFREEQFSRLREERRKRRELVNRQSEESIPVTLSYLPEYERNHNDTQEVEHVSPKVDKPAYFPFKTANVYLNREGEEVRRNNLKIKNNEWMKDYDNFDDKKLQAVNMKTEMVKMIESGKLKEFLRAEDKIDEEESMETTFWQRDYGLPDPKTPPSNVNCSGCGAILHCVNTNIPGYLPSEIFKNCSKFQLKRTICQRCHFLKEFNVALNINVSPEEYPEIISKMKSERALAILMVDLLDFPNSIWPGIINIIGVKRPIIIVGNKVDMLPAGQPGYLKHIENCLRRAVSQTNVRSANIKDVALISAKTGYGVEDLITKLHNVWKYKGDVYIVGCTNVGKSTLFNSLLQSDYCKSSASDLIEKATVSQWPGTTLNLLKFPIFRITDIDSKLRYKRLITDTERLKIEEKLKLFQGKQDKNTNITLMGYIGRTFPNKGRQEGYSDPFSYNFNIKSKDLGYKTGVNENSLQYILSKWCYDTPGVVHPEQILNILTLDELTFMLPKSTLKPRNFYMKPESTLFLAGLGRIDFLEGEKPIRFTVLASEDLPITICNTSDADDLYSNFLGTPLFGVPFGSEERLKEWPKLEKGDVMTVVGMGERYSSADITLSSAGWVAVTGIKESEYKILAWTPKKRGIHLRMPSVLPNAVCIKGRRIIGTPAYNLGKNPYEVMDN